ncbi:ATP-binding protein [Streptomyces sp. NBC_00344]|uniref:ATP-binding protein n=1 Tax=Streptomyces sp. NBC_00344 TaxID=2975720 RepID=UPI002E1DC3A0
MSLSSAMGSDAPQDVVTVQNAAAVFEGEPGDIGAARLFATAFLHAHSSPAALLGTAQLVVSELVTNAFKYAPGPVLVEIGIQPGAVELTVWDSSTTIPHAGRKNPERIGGHGLEIVLALTESLTAESHPVGKKITARLMNEAADGEK